MAKRFTDTEKWNDPWYRKLNAEQKVVWQFLVDKCDSAGFWKKDLEMAAFLCGFDIQTHLEGLNKGKERVKDVGDYLQITEFVKFQYGELTENCNPHKPIIALLNSYKKKGYLRVPGTLEDKDKEKEKEKDRGSVRGVFHPPSVEEVRAYCRERGNDIDPNSFVDFYTSKGWKIGSQPMKDWQAAVRTWEKRSNPNPAKKERLCVICQQKVGASWVSLGGGVAHLSCRDKTPVNPSAQRSLGEAKAKTFG